MGKSILYLFIFSSSLGEQCKTFSFFSRKDLFIFQGFRGLPALSKPTVAPPLTSIMHKQNLCNDASTQLMHNSELTMDDEEGQTLVTQWKPRRNQLSHPQPNPFRKEWCRWNTRRHSKRNNWWCKLTTSQRRKLWLPSP